MNFGEQVSAAYEFLVEVFEDIASVMNSLTQDLMDAGLEPWRPIKLPSGRITFIYYGLYAPAVDRKSGEYRFAILLQMEIQRAITDDEPQILAVAVDFGNPFLDQEVWNGWKKEGGRCLMKYVRDHGNYADIPLEMLQSEFAPEAKRGVGVVIPICSLRNREEVGIKFSQPILKAIRSLGYQETSSP